MERKQDSPRGPCGRGTGRSALLMAGVLAAGVLAAAGPASAAKADGCYGDCGYGASGGYNMYTGYHASQYGGVLPGRGGFQPFADYGYSDVSLSVEPSSGEVGTTFTWTATVTCRENGENGEYAENAAENGENGENGGGEPVVSGTVTFYVQGPSFYAQTVPITNGQATLTLTPPKAGYYAAWANYNGDGRTADGMQCYGNSSDYASITVTRPAPPAPPAPPGPPVVKVGVHVKVANNLNFRFGQLRAKYRPMYAPAAPAAPSHAVPVTG